MASNLAQLFQTNMLGWFLTIHTPAKNYAELDPFFIASFFQELGLQWEIYDGNGICHNVQFNASAAKPLLTNGWDTLTTYYSWNGYRKLYLYYYGQNKFFMIIDNNSNYERPSFFPPFHSLSTSLEHYRSFFMRIRDEDLTSTQLVLRQDLGNFLTSPGHSSIKVSGPLDYVVTISLIINRENGRRVKFGQGWKTFCELNQIVNGNVLNFKAACTIEYSNILIVRIV